MLHYETVPANTLELLKLISPRLHELGFYLAGGTALALRLGHRVSVDLDFFKSDQFSPPEIANELKALSGSPSNIIQQSKGSIALIHQDTKLEFLRYDPPLLKLTEKIDDIPFASLPDNVAMKLSALVGRGSKKDFIDIAALLETMSLSEMLEYYSTKFPNSDQFLVLKSLTWFDDADSEPDPVFLKSQNWIQVKKVIQQACE